MTLFARADEPVRAVDGTSATAWEGLPAPQPSGWTTCASYQTGGMFVCPRLETTLHPEWRSTTLLTCGDCCSDL
jgi:hypothetical protein